MEEVLTKLVVDCSTGEQSYIPLTPEEIAQREADAVAAAVAEAERIAAKEDKAAKKAAAIQKLITLGLSEDEALAIIN
jgi:uncharacterized protein (DUF849 family)